MSFLMRLSPARLLCLLLSLALGSGALQAGDERPQPADVSDPSFDLSFQGGSLSDLVAEISSKRTVPLNIVGSSADLAAAKLPAFTVRNVHAFEIFTAASKLLEKSGYTLSVYRPSLAVLTKSAPEGPPILFYSFEIAPYLGSRSVDDIVDAIHVAWSMDDRVDPKSMKIKYHPATGLILISGPIEGIDIAKRVTGSLDVRPNDAKH